jgi:methyl-accepting chemotaxis protein
MQMSSIRTKLTLAIVLLTAASLSVLGSLSYWNARKILIQETESSLMSLSRTNSEKLGMWLEMRKNEISILANSPLIGQGSNDNRLAYLRDENKRNPLYQRFMVMDLKGDASYTIGENKNLADRDYFKQAIAGKTVISDPIFGKSDGKAIIVAAAPLTRNGSVVGALAGTVLLDDLIKLLAEIKAGESGYAYVVQNDGLIIFHPSKELAMKKNLLQDPATEPSLKEITARMVKGEQGVAQYSFNGLKKYLAFAPIPGTTWSLAVNVPVAEVYAKLKTLMWTSLLIALVVLGLAVAISFVIAAGITRPINAMKLMLQDIAQGEGDLTKRLNVQSNDELGETSRCFNTFIEKIHSIISQVAQTTTRVATAATQVYTTSEQMATGAEQVASQSGTVATASEEMSATSGDIAQNCSMAADASREASRKAMDGVAVVERTVGIMNQIADRVKETSRTIESLGVRSDQIGEIVGTIEDIADQTNLLALNAAIEAARAGEQGRGFAVVADEVRALAERTTRATHEISEMIKAIQGETKTAVEAMEEGVHRVEEGRGESARSGEAIQSILQQINEVAMQVNQIATAAEEQTATTGEISSNMLQITEVVQQTAQGAHESAAAASQLNRVAEELQRLVGQFRLN